MSGGFGRRLTGLSSVVAVAALAGLLLLASYGKAEAQDKKSDKVQIQLFIMSQCPYAIEFINQIIPFLEQTAEFAEFSLEFLGTEEEGSFLSLHGEPEVLADIAEICVQKHAGPGAVSMKVIQCMGQDVAAMPGNWKTCAAGLGQTVIEAIDKCQSGEEGKRLLRDSMALGNSIGVEGSPTLYINGQQYSGPRSLEKILRFTCSVSVANPIPRTCAELPALAPLELTIVTDPRCKPPHSGCEPDMPQEVFQMLKQVVPQLTLRVIQWPDPEAQRLMKDEQLPRLPLLLLGKSIEKDEVFEPLSEMMEKTPSGNYYSLLIGATFDPLAEICDNATDDDNNGKADCEDESCKGMVLCRPEKLGQLDLFIMSYCPYGIMAVMALKPVIEAFGKDIDLNIHYVATVEAGEYYSMHGQEEKLENIRQLCIAKIDKTKLLPYMWCLYDETKNLTWVECAASVGLDARKVDKCVTGGEGLGLALADAQIAEQLGVQASPTWLAHNKHLFQGIEPADVWGGMCNERFKSQGCKKTPPQGQPVDGGSCR